MVDNDEMYFNGNREGITIRVTQPGETDGAARSPAAVVIVVPRGTLGYTLQLPGTPAVETGTSLRMNWDMGTIEMVMGATPVANVLEYREVFTQLAQMMFIGPFRHAVNLTGGEAYYDLKVGRPFISAWRAMKTGDDKQANQIAMRLTDEIGRIFGLQRLDINAAASDETLQLFKNGVPFKLAEVGAGLSEFIVVLASIAVKRPTWVLIDEPELHLHCSLQLDFLTALGAYATEGVLFATHSYGLARSAADELYVVRPHTGGGSEVVPYEHAENLSELLGELTFAGYQDLGYDLVLLVEGRTEIKVVQQLLRLYGKEHQVVLMPLGGGTLINGRSKEALDEVLRISKNVAALIDSERAAVNTPLERALQDFVDLCSTLSVPIKCHVLERRAMENYFTGRAIQEAVGAGAADPGPYEKDVHKRWRGKNCNWRIARAMTKLELDQTDLGRFLSSLEPKVRTPGVS